MLVSTSIISLLAVAASARKCKDIQVPVSITAENAILDVKAATTKADAAEFALLLARQGYNYPQAAATGTKNVSGHYSLGATYCEPDHGPGKELQILTHGVAFDRRYWDLPYNNYNYSYTKLAVDHGYSTLTWDRLGVADSSKGDPINEIQIFLEVAALHELTTKAVSGQLPGIPHQFGKAIHVGHSFGSSMTYALANAYPSQTKAIVLTGFSQFFSYVPLFALANNFIPVADAPLLAKHYPSGYIASGASISIDLSFFPPSGDFDPAIVDYAFKVSQPTTQGELLTVGAPLQVNNTFTGPVLIITGEKDLPFCGGDCFSTSSAGKGLTSLLDVSKGFFPNNSHVNTTVVPGAGHGLNLGYSHTYTYGKILDFISSV